MCLQPSVSLLFRRQIQSQTPSHLWGYREDSPWEQKADNGIISSATPRTVSGVFSPNTWFWVRNIEVTISWENKHTGNSIGAEWPCDFYSHSFHSGRWRDQGGTVSLKSVSAWLVSQTGTFLSDRHPPHMHRCKNQAHWETHTPKKSQDCRLLCC